MGYAHYLLPDGREAGYAVEATCDADDCGTAINRGMGYLCGELPDGHRPVDAPGCGRYYCEQHLDQHECPNPACGQWPHEDESTDEPCARIAGHGLPHRDRDDVEFTVTENDHSTGEQAA